MEKALCLNQSKNILLSRRNNDALRKKLSAKIRSRLICRAEAVSDNGGSASSLVVLDGPMHSMSSMGSVDASMESVPLSSVLAAKVSSARELARRLAEEKVASSASESSPDFANIRKVAETASVAAAEAAARADRLARALRRAEASRDVVSRLKAENEALRALLMEVVQSDDGARERVASLIQRFSNSLADTIAAPLPLSVPVKPDEALQQLEAEAAKETVQLAVEPVVPLVNTLKASASAALAARQSIFTLPASPVPVSSTIRLYYNRLAGPLPPTGKLQIKAGLNKWETIVVLDMSKVQELEVGPGQEWWVAALELPADLYHLDYVIMDAERGGVDNNGAKDFNLALSNAPTPEQIAERRVAMLRAAEEARAALFAKEEDRIWRQVEADAAVACAKAKEQLIEKRRKERYATARVTVTERRRPALFELPAEASQAGVFTWLPGPPRSGSRTLLAYNKAHGSLAPGNGVTLHMGVDGWWNKATMQMTLSPMPSEDVSRYNLDPTGEWWACWVDVPYSAAVLNFVLSDTALTRWDNNGMRDFHTCVDGAAGEAELLEMVYCAIEAESEASDRSEEERVMKRAARRIEEQEAARRKRRDALRSRLYTIPISARAGEKVEVYYNPDVTMLRGRPNIFLRYGWNRWNTSMSSKAGVQKMAATLPGGIGFLKATLEVPADAWGLDMVFSDGDATSGGFVDNNGGLDYHTPVTGGPAPAKLNIVHVAVEMAPIAKVGGMGDVVTALGRAVQEEGHQVEVILPKYNCINYSQVLELRQEGGFDFGGCHVRLWRGLVEGLSTTFLEPENGMFWVGTIYGRNDDAARFNFFCGAALQYLKSFNVRADVVHCHDWQSAVVAWGDRGNARCVFTIHNLNYGTDLISRAMGACQVATTVSPTYAREVSGHPAIAPNLTKLYGILNGIDPEIWDPAEDEFLPLRYTADNVTEGKAAARKELRTRLKMAQVDVPMVGCVTRLVAQKGIHLIKHAAWRTVERGGQFVLLGSAPDARVQAEFNALRDQLMRSYPERSALVFTYDEPLSHLIYAGCDIFLVPSMFEPCGLTQMIAMRYGAVPVVRSTGGLTDTVFDIDHDETRAQAAGRPLNGFSFEGSDSAGMDYALNRALSQCYSNRPAFRTLQRSNMTIDWSWNSPALDYIEIYYKALR